MMEQKKASILLAHGSSDERWQQPFKHMARDIQSQLSTHRESGPVELAFMELCEPSLSHCCASLAAQGIKHIDVYPLFFAAGRHLRKDVPEQLQAIEAEHHIQTELHAPIGQAEAVKQAIVQVLTEAI